MHEQIVFSKNSEAYAMMIDPAKDDLRDWIIDNDGLHDDDGIHDMIFELADMQVPIYTWDLLTVARDNINLMHIEVDSDFIGQECTVAKVLQLVIFEEIRTELNNYVEELREKEEAGDEW